MPPQRRSRWWIAVLTFVVGVVVGVLIVGFLDKTAPDFSAAPSAPPTSPSPAASQSVPAAASAQVNAACLRVINEAQDVATILSEVGPAITAVNLQQLDDIVRRLQSIQTRLDVDLRDCKVNAEVSRTPTVVPSPLSTVDPSASPTPLPTASPNR
ncbi:MAG TPA: hypothetical protein VNT27_02375 [Propionibacteriaceae bacterium]|nr:hypothetical protein [Propionibacteriaceae bacterium]